MRNAELYLFQRQDTVYPTIVASIEGERWLAMIGLNGMMETALKIPLTLRNLFQQVLRSERKAFQRAFCVSW